MQKTQQDQKQEWERTQNVWGIKTARHAKVLSSQQKADCERIYMLPRSLGDQITPPIYLTSQD